MKPKEISFSEIESKIFLIQGEKVLLDSDLAELYQVPTRRLNEQVRRNMKRFPKDFIFILSNQNFATSSFHWGGRRKPPMAFTEQGVAMLSSVLNSDRAIDVNIAIMRAKIRGGHLGIGITERLLSARAGDAAEVRHLSPSGLERFFYF